MLWSQRRLKILNWILGVHLEHFRLVKCLQLEQAFNEHKWKQVIFLSAERRTSITKFISMDQLAKASHQLKQSVRTDLPRNLLPPKEWDTYKLDFSFSEFLGSLDPSHQGPLFQPVELSCPNFDPLLKDLSEKTWTKIL